MAGTRPVLGYQRKSFLEERRLQRWTPRPFVPCNLTIFYIQFVAKTFKGLISKSHQIQKMWLISKFTFQNFPNKLLRYSLCTKDQSTWHNAVLLMQPGGWHWLQADPSLCTTPHPTPNYLPKGVLTIIRIIMSAQNSKMSNSLFVKKPLSKAEIR